MRTTIVKEFKKSSIQASSVFDLYQIERKSQYLLDCKVTKSLDHLSFEFLCDNEKNFADIKKLSLLQRYRALINLQYLYEDSKRLYISLNPENVMFDLNMMPKIIMRDIYEYNAYDENDFIKQYKAMIGYILQNKYSFCDYYEGGNQLLAKHKMTSEYKDINTLDQLIDALNNAYEHISMTLQTTMIEVDKRKFKRTKVLNRIYITCLIIVIAVSAYFGGFKLSAAQTFNSAYEAYIKQDYISVIEDLENTRITQMNKNTKFILAISNIKTEALNDEQKNNILSSVSLNADERILEFWIHIGKSDFDEAVDVAKQLGNKEYIAYGYMKQKSKIENDTTLSGTQREQKLKEIESSIKDLDITTEDSNVKK